jgi:AcrB/AcrD/AcrF family protein
VWSWPCCRAELRSASLRFSVLALIGILIRNSVILIVQIEQLKEEGRPVWDAVVEATEHRMRPIMLTAVAASLALIPIAREIFWGPMAYAMMGGIIVGTVLTLLFLPALHVAWFRIKEPAPAMGNNHENPLAPKCKLSLQLMRPSARTGKCIGANMKQVLTVFTFGIGAPLFLTFFTTLKPTAVTAASASSEPGQCSTKASPALACRSLVLAAALWPEVLQK